MKNSVYLMVFFLFVCSSVFSQEIDFTKEDKQIFDKYLAYIQPHRCSSKELVLEKTALFFVNTPYKAATLEKNDAEKLVIHLRGFDCVTYVESVMALTQMVLAGENKLEDFAWRVQNIRYRNGKINGYPSRLHYTSDWAFDNAAKKNIRILTRCLGGIAEKKQIHFMSSHPNAYRQLKNNQPLISEIKKMEAAMNSRGGFLVIDKGKIAKTEKQIPHLCIVAFATSVKGLDTSHLGFAFRKNGKLHFIHASSSQAKVVVDKRTVAEYCNSQKSCTGILVFEVL